MFGKQRSHRFEDVRHGAAGKLPSQTLIQF
jgi:hypothetical protein